MDIIITTIIMKKNKELNPCNYVDIHSHILNLSDGPESFDESKEMLEYAQENGVSKIVAAPTQINDAYKFSIKDLRDQVKKLNKNNKLVVYEGAENYAEYGLNIISINKGRYLLLELPESEYPDFCDNIIIDLIRSKYIPIIISPEKNEAIRQNPKILENLVNRGCLLQLNAKSLLVGSSRSRFAHFLLKNDLYHVFASGAHSMKGYKLYFKAIKKLKKYVSEQKFLELTLLNPEKVIDNVKIVPSSVVLKEKMHSKFKIRGLLSRLFNFDFSYFSKKKSDVDNI